MLMQRGDLVTVAAPGDYSKPRPALIIQSELFDELPSVTLCLITSTLRDAPIFRITVDPSSTNGLQRVSQIQVDKSSLLHVSGSATRSADSMTLRS